MKIVEHDEETFALWLSECPSTFSGKKKKTVRDNERKKEGVTR